MLGSQKRFQNSSVASHWKSPCPYSGWGLMSAAGTYYRLKSHSKSPRSELFPNPGRISPAHLLHTPFPSLPFPSFLPPGWNSCYLIFSVLLPLEGNDFSSVCSKPDLKAGPRGSRKVDPLSYSLIVCFFTCNIPFLSRAVI